MIQLNIPTSLFFERVGISPINIFLPPPARCLLLLTLPSLNNHFCLILHLSFPLNKLGELCSLGEFFAAERFHHKLLAGLFHLNKTLSLSYVYESNGIGVDLE